MRAAHQSLRRRDTVPRSPWLLVLIVAGSLLLAWICAWDIGRVVFGFRIKRMLGRSALDVTLVGLGTCMVMLGSTLRGRAGRLWTAPLRWFGRLSYEVYLLHVLVIIAILDRWHAGSPGPLAAWISAVLAGTAVAAWLMSRLLSEPANRRLRGAPLPAQLPPADAPTSDAAVLTAPSL